MSTSPPLYSVEMKKLRGKTSITKFAAQCGISRETVRLVEKGDLVPSKELFTKWLEAAGSDPKERADIVKSLLQHKLGSRALQELADLRSLVEAGDSKDACADEIVGIMRESGYLPDNAVPFIRHQIRQILGRHDA